MSKRKKWTRKTSRGDVFYFSPDGKKTAVEVFYDDDEKQWNTTILKKVTGNEDATLWGNKYSLTKIGRSFKTKKPALRWAGNWIKKHPRG